jgi:hypothetical protein
MTQSVKIISVLVCCAGMISIPANAFAQTDTIDAVKTNESGISPHSFYTNLGYGSNMIYLGSTISRNQAYGYGSLIYGFKDALYASFSAVHLDEMNPFIAFYIGSLSYGHTFNSWFDISAGIYRYQFANSLQDTLFNSFFYGDLTLGFDWKILYSKISAGSIFAGGTQGYLQVRNSRYFETPAFGGKKVYFSFDPYVNILFGSLTRIETSTDTIITVSSPFLKNISGAGSGNGNGTGNGNGSGNGAGAGSSTSSGSASTTASSQTVTSTISASDFSLMEIDFGVPVSFNMNRITIEAEPGFILPIYNDPIYRNMKGFVFTFSIFIKIF